MSNSNDRVEIFHRLNLLKLKTGIPLDSNEAGHIDPKAIQRAQGIIDGSEEQFNQELEEVLVKLDSVWEDAKMEKNSKKLNYWRNQLCNYANNIKDLAKTYDYSLMDYFGKSLRDFCEVLDVQNQAHQIIVQAHVDVMWVVFKESLKNHGGRKAEELKLIVAKAIEKYS